MFRLLAPASQTVGLNPLSPPVFVEDWTRLHEVGRTEGPDSAVLQIVEFTDFECPACARYERTLKGFLGRHEHEVRRTVIHWPLDIHPYAPRAALTAECAAAQGRFFEVSSQLYSKQLDFSTNPWMSAGVEGHVADTSAFRTCLADSSAVELIEQGKRAASALQLTGTPSVLLNGYLYVGAPPDSLLEAALARAKIGDLPPRASKWGKRRSAKW